MQSVCSARPRSGNRAEEQILHTLLPSSCDRSAVCAAGRKPSGGEFKTGPRQHHHTYFLNTSSHHQSAFSLLFFISHQHRLRFTSHIDAQDDMSTLLGAPMLPPALTPYTSATEVIAFLRRLQERKTTPHLTLVYGYEVIARNQAGLDAEYGNESKASLSLPCLASCPCWPC